MEPAPRPIPTPRRRTSKGSVAASDQVDHAPVTAYENVDLVGKSKPEAYENVQLESTAENRSVFVPKPVPRKKVVANAGAEHDEPKEAPKSTGAIRKAPQVPAKEQVNPQENHDKNEIRERRNSSHSTNSAASSMDSGSNFKTASPK